MTARLSDTATVQVDIANRQPTIDVPDYDATPHTNPPTWPAGGGTGTDLHEDPDLSLQSQYMILDSQIASDDQGLQRTPF